MSLRDAIIGEPLASSEGAKEELTVLTGVPVLGLDALASTGYGPEAALTALLPLGTPGLHYFPFIALSIVLLLAFLYMSYQQTAGAYPGGGGAYTVAKDNLGVQPGLWASAALLLDYMLNVAVGIAAGVGAIVSAVPTLHPYLLALCLLVLLTLTLANLRGIRESGLIFIIPVFVFIACIGAAITIGLISALQTGGHPHPVTAPPPLPQPTASVGTWLLLAAFANGCTAMTGVEAVSNGVPYFRDPKVRNARRTLTVTVGILSLYLLALGYLCPTYHIGPMDEQKLGSRRFSRS
jgi:amino acid transporter